MFFIPGIIFPGLLFKSMSGNVGTPINCNGSIEFSFLKTRDVVISFYINRVRHSISFTKGWPNVIKLLNLKFTNVCNKLECFSWQEFLA
jgi:hypothetical protein